MKQIVKLHIAYLKSDYANLTSVSFMSVFKEAVIEPSITMCKNKELKKVLF